MRTTLTLSNKRAIRSAKALLALCALAALQGCEDQLLPFKEIQLEEKGEMRIAFSERTLDSLGRPGGSRLFLIDSDGSQRIDLSNGVLNSAPGAEHAAVVDDRGSVWIVPLKAPLPVSPYMVISRQIDEHSVAISSDGTRITYTSDGGRATIATVSGSPPVNLTVKVARETTPSFSPDGRRLAFLSVDSTFSYPHARGKLNVVDIDGNGLRTLAAVEDVPDSGYGTVEWSPSGERIAYHDNGSIRVVPFDGAAPITIAAGFYASWSPEGDSILYTDGASFDLYLAAADGSGSPRQITDTPTEIDLNGRFSPDARKILYTARTGPLHTTVGSLRVYDRATGVTTILSAKAHKGFWVIDN